MEQWLIETLDEKTSGISALPVNGRVIYYVYNVNGTPTGKWVTTLHLSLRLWDTSWANVPTEDAMPLLGKAFRRGLGACPMFGFEWDKRAFPVMDKEGTTARVNEEIDNFRRLLLTALP